MQSTWSGAATAMPGQPFAQDPCMPLPTPPNPTTQLEEAKRRLLNQSRTAGDSATPVKPRLEGCCYLTLVFCCEAEDAVRFWRAITHS